MPKEHPCYDKSAKAKYARIHLPVVADCNISCNYCNRLYSCANENRPGVTSKLITPEEAFGLTKKAKDEFDFLKIAGIAGPGEALSRPDLVYETFKIVRKEFPDIHLCLSTNGYALPENIDLIEELGIKYITVTINTLNKKTAEKIYKNCDVELLLENQINGIISLIKLGVCVKVNTVLIPEVNINDIVDVASKIAEIGVYAHNIMSFYAVKGSQFQNLREPLGWEISKVREKSSFYIRQLSHCNRCRADAVGYLS